MGATIVNLSTRQQVRFAHQFECLGCLRRVYAAVHHGHRGFCLTCQEVGPVMSRWLHERAGRGDADQGEREHAAALTLPDATLVDPTSSGGDAA